MASLSEIAETDSDPAGTVIIGSRRAQRSGVRRYAQLVDGISLVEPLCDLRAAGNGYH
jgi:hypothetical protein